ncbi:dymeclin-like [Crotalus adamanteus]|uniref:Dymeclin n=1 Tax=Crotalus adamanteus TaxID=8729 RepID=A0AAW1C2Z2_CROAD
MSVSWLRLFARTSRGCASDHNLDISESLKFPELKFKYVEEEQPEEFFIPYVWSLVYNSAVALYWNPQDIRLFTRDSG